MENIDLEKNQSQMRKGVLEFCILSIISKGDSYASDILADLKQADLIVVEGTLYPLLSRLKASELLSYTWVESTSGPPRKYYKLTEQGVKVLESYKENWKNFTNSINKLIKSHEENN